MGMEWISRRTGLYADAMLAEDDRASERQQEAADD